MKVFVVILVMAAFICICAGAAAQQAWAARYNGPGNGWDGATAIAADSSGNVYVTGESYGVGTGGDYVTIKYDPSGNQLWAATYNGPGNSSEQTSAIALDSGGNAYVTGLSVGVGTGADYATIKYDPSGNQLWVARYNGPGNDWDKAYGIAVDSGGNAYVTGVSLGIGTAYDYVTIKYDPAGSQLWVRRYNGPGNGNDEARAIALDSSGNVYVTGLSMGSGTQLDYATIKYDPSGVQLWAATYDGPGNGNDEARAIALDSSGNVYVTGQSAGSGTGDDYATIKYDGLTGNPLWPAAARYDGPASLDDLAWAIALDSGGNVYVTGGSDDGVTSGDYATVKYNGATGNQLWAARYNGPANGYDEAWAIALDSSGNVFITGESTGIGTSTDYVTVGYDPAGNQFWVARYDGPANGSDMAHAIAVDSGGSIYVTGGSEGSGSSHDYATIKYYNPAPSQLWERRYNGPANGRDGMWYPYAAYPIAVDPAGNVHVTGESTGSGTGLDYATIKYDTAGTQLWVPEARCDNWPVSGNDGATAITVDSSGNVYVTGYSTNAAGNYDYATMKYGPSGNQLWAAAPRYDGTGSWLDVATAIAVDPAGNVYVTGFSWGGATGFDYATIKYNSAGTQQWVARYDYSWDSKMDGNDKAWSITVDSSGNVYVTGESWAEKSLTDKSLDYATIMYSGATGSQVWAARYDGPARDVDEAFGIVLDSSGNVYITGESTGIGTGLDYATIKYDPAGNQLRLDRYDGPANGHDSGYAICLDSSGNPHVTGESAGISTGQDYATIKYDPSLNRLWPAAARYDGPASLDDVGRDLAVDAAGNVCVTGFSTAFMTPGGIPIHDYATIKYDSAGNQLWLARYDYMALDDKGYGIGLDSSGNVYVTGESQDPATGLDYYDYATLKYDGTSPTGSIVINGGAPSTNTVNVTLGLSATDTGTGVAQMRFSNDGSSWSAWEAYWPTKGWPLPGQGLNVVYVQFSDQMGNVSQSYLDTIVLGTPDDLSQARSYQDGAPVTVIDKIVTAQPGVGGVPAGIFYIEEPARFAGIRVASTAVPLVGNSVGVTGTMGTTLGGERYINATNVIALPGTALGPLGTNTKTLAGTIMEGLLIKTAGTVRTVGGNSYTIADGYYLGAVEVWTTVQTGTGGPPGVTVGQFVVVKGVASTQGVRVILAVP